MPTVPPGTDFVAVTRFQRETGELMRVVAGASAEIGRARDRLRHMQAALLETPRAPTALFARLDAFGAALTDLQTELDGDPIRGRLDESSVPSVRNRVGRVVSGYWDTRLEPTATQRRNVAIAQEGFTSLRQRLAQLLDVAMPQLEADLEAAGAPWTPGRRLTSR